MFICLPLEFNCIFLVTKSKKFLIDILLTITNSNLLMSKIRVFVPNHISKWISNYSYAM